MIVFVDDHHPTGIGESLSGAKAFYVNSSLIDDWHRVETHPEFQRLGSIEQESVRQQFSRSVLIHQNIKATRFY